MGRITGPAYVTCRQHRPGRTFEAFATSGPSLPRHLPTASLREFGPLCYSNGNGDGEFFYGESIDSGSCDANDRALISSKIRPSRNNKNGEASKDSVPGFQVKLRALFFAATILFGVPNLDGLDSGFRHSRTSLFDSKALALDLSSDTTWPPTSSLSSSSTPIPRHKQRYWDTIASGNTKDIMFANEKLVDSAVSTISTMYYDTSGGFNFNSQEFYANWKELRKKERMQGGGDDSSLTASLAENGFSTRENAVQTLKAIVATLNDPYSKYLTREELRMELVGGSDGFLGLGALVDSSEPPPSPYVAFDTKKSNDRAANKGIENRAANRPWYGGQGGISFDSPQYSNQQFEFAVPISSRNNNKKMQPKNTMLSVSQAANLPVITAIIPDSPAERAGLVVGDRIASVGEYQFTGMSKSQVEKALKEKFHAQNYFGRADLTIAKQVIASMPSLLNDSNARYDADGNIIEEKYVFQDGWYQPNNSRQRVLDDIPTEQVLGYKLSHVKSITTTQTAKLDQSASISSRSAAYQLIVGGDATVHYELLTPSDSIFKQVTTGQRVGYIRLTRFSRTSTEGYIKAVNSLEEAGAQSYIIDLRNNYGGVIQEAMLTASTLLRDPHSVLCWTLNSRGGRKPQENMEYVVDRYYPGYLLSSEPSTVSRDQVRREHPDYLDDGGAGWVNPTSYATLKELKLTRGIKPAHNLNRYNDGFNKNAGDGLYRQSNLKEIDLERLSDIMARNSQKKLVILINEGTASAAEVFASTLHDNGRTTALVGTKTFGKGIIQHTFPMPDGGGLRLTVAEYLTPSLQHVTKVGSAKFDSGINPDVRCESNQGIPQNIGADLCVGVALDVLESEGG